MLLSKIFNNKKSNKYYSLNDIDRQMEHYLNYDNGFFVELGANDGETQSNTLYFEEQRNWKGVLIEPAPNNYLKCKKRRGEKSKVFCNACVGFDYSEKFVEMAYSNLMSTPLSTESDIKDGAAHASKGKVFLKQYEDVFTFGSVAKTLNAILLEACAPHKIDFLSLDVEGAEIEVLKGFDFAKFSFNYICVESRSPEVIKSFLLKNNYNFLKKLSDHDYLFSSI
jgi:FkbM family methyltransferase